MDNSRVCQNCGKRFSKPPYASWRQWDNRRSCSHECARILISQRARSRPRVCTLCHRLLPAESFGLRRKRNNKRDSRCMDCQRVLYRAMYSIGRYKGGRPPRKKPPDAVKVLAKNVLRNAVRRGQVQRDRCQVCGKSRAEGHHANYGEPLLVLWVCRKCHMKLHRKPTSTPFTEADAIHRLREGAKK